MYDLIDRIVNLDIGQRGVTGLYEPARALASGPVCQAAAQALTGLQPGDAVFIITGSLSRAQISNEISENDGPIGAAVLARAISFGFRAVPVILSDATVLAPVAKMAELAGCTVMSLEQARASAELKRFTGVAATDTCSKDDATAQKDCEKLLDGVRPKAAITVERAGLHHDGTYRDMLGQDYSMGRARLDHIVTGAMARGIPTIGIGDGGNEIGMGAIKEAVHEHIPHGPNLCAETATDIVIPAGVSNWGCYGLVAALAILTENTRLAHTPDLERRLIESSPMVGLIDGTAGTLEATVDGLPLDVHVSIVELLAQAVRRALA